jgi:Domain of unknown function (DUF4186)
MSRKERKPLGKMTCTSTACDDGLHCFRQAKKRGEQHVQGGHCRDCGADLVDFPRVHKRDHGDVKYTWSSLKYELIRHHFWHLDIDIKALNYARRKGMIGMRGAAENRIRKSVGPAEPAFDGRQTGKSGNPLYYAQHATATCCRKCIEYWHGIPQHQALSEEQIGYFTELLTGFIDHRLPNLTEHGEKVPPIRRNGNDDPDLFSEE